MLEKAIEHWLTNANELGYQPAFVHALIARGEEVLYVSRHRSLEQGRDVVSRGSDGVVRVYQLKGGQINIRKWREIAGELGDLVRLPVRHPSVRPEELRRAFLVTNGQIIDEVEANIQDFNRGIQAQGLGFPLLEVMQREELLGMFLDLSERVLPIEPGAARELFNTYCADGADMLEKDQFADMLWKLCFDRDRPTRAERINAITSSVLVTSFVLRPYREAANHYAMFEGWMLLAAALSRFDAVTEGCEATLVRATLEVAWDEVDGALAALRDEALERDNLLEGGWVGDGGDVYRARATLVLGALAASEVVRCGRGDGQVVNPRVTEFLEKFRRSLWLWGEGAMPAFFAVAKCLELAGESHKSQNLLLAMCDAILECNAERGNREASLPSPYYSAEDILLNMIGRAPLEKRLDRREFGGHSWTLWSVVWWMARRDMRAELAERWRAISDMGCKGFEPEDAAAFWSFKTERGVNRHGVFERPQSWAKLKADATAEPNSSHVWPLWGPRLLLFFLVAPFRWREPYGTLIDQSVSLGSSGQN